MRTILLATIAALSACSTPSAVEKHTFEAFSIQSYGDEKPDNVVPTESWGSQDNPNLFDNSLVYNVDELPLVGEAEKIPWAGAYWPVYEDSINSRWDGKNSQSPSEKYAEAFGVSDFPEKVSKDHGIEKYSNRTACTEDYECNDEIGEACAIREGKDSGYCIPTWWGICHAWAPVSILEKEPEQPVTVNGVEFKVQDIKALLTLSYNRTRSRFVSLRCNEDQGADEIEYDEYDRPTGSDEECRDTNPGTYHVLLTNFLGIKGQSFVEDRTFDVEVWNQPIRGYRITQMDPIGVDRAHELIGVPDDEEASDSVEALYTFSESVQKSAWLHKGPYTVTEGAAVAVEMAGEVGDADLYVRFGLQPTKDSYDCRPYVSHSNESCDLSAQSGDTELYVSVFGYSDAEVSVDIMVSNPDAPQNDQATEYEFNRRAESFYHVKLEVDYLTESSSNIDGNLASGIDTYTRVDRYQYVLEIDRHNDIIGGEWIGSSKKSHPDFLWLPTERSNWPRPAGGSMNWDLVSDLLDRSLIEETPDIEDGASTTQINEEFSIDGNEWKHFGPFAVQGTLQATMTGTNDADLYVNTDSRPSDTNYTCRPYAGHSNEECSVSGPATVYVSVKGFNDAKVKLSITFEDAENVADTEASESETSHLNTTGTVGFQDMNLYVLPVQAGDKIRIQTTADGDIDLYVRFDNPPTTNDYDARGYTSTGNEKIDFDANTDGILHIGVHGYAGGDFSLTTTDR